MSDDAGDEAPEDDAQVAGNHGWTSAGGAVVGTAAERRQDARRRLGLVLPEDEGVGEGFGDALLVAARREGGGVGCVLGASSRTRAGQVRESTGRTEARLTTGEFGAAEGGAELVGELLALRDPRGLRGEPGGGDGLAGGGVELGGVEVDAGAAGGGVEQKAGERARVVGDAGAVVEREGRAGGGWGCVAVARHDDGEAARGEQRAQAEGEGEGDVFFDECR